MVQLEWARAVAVSESTTAGAVRAEAMSVTWMVVVTALVFTERVPRFGHPLEAHQAYKQRMGWKFPYVSTFRRRQGGGRVRHVCPDDAPDVGSRDAQDFGDLVLEHKEGAITVVLPDPGQGLSRAILERDLVRLCCHTAPLFAALPSAPYPPSRTSI